MIPTPTQATMICTQVSLRVCPVPRVPAGTGPSVAERRCWGTGFLDGLELESVISSQQEVVGSLVNKVFLWSI